MLESLTIENYALIEHLEIALSEDLNIITGETGAGKSILLGALGLLLGGKNDGAATRDNTKSCVVEGQFSIGGLHLEELFEENDWEYEESISIRRVITPSGKSRSFVGDIPVALSDLKLLSSRLIDIHSQHQNQILADESFRIRAVDLLFAESRELHALYSVEYNRLTQLRSELRRIEEIAASAKRDEEWLTHQVEELTMAKLRAGEEAEAEAELKILENSEQINLVLSTLLARLDGEDGEGALISLRASQKELTSIGEEYPAAREFAERLGGVLAELKDVSSSVASENERIESDPARLEQLSSRLDTIYTLCQKHRAQDLAELITIRDNYAAQLSTILSSDDQIAELKRKISECEAAAFDLAHKIAAHRRAVAPSFAESILLTLSRLGMEQSQFIVNITDTTHLTESGANHIDFLFSSSPAKSPQPMDRIASGGEISRVVLAIKALLSQRMELPTIIFDEIDTGVSGRIADAMGEIIFELSRTMQVIDITHLPQVASKGNSHFVVYKESGRTHITKLSDSERVEQIAKMLSGSKITSAALEQAKILLS